MSERVNITEEETASGETEGAAETPETLKAQIDLLQEENRRLREQYARTRQTRYRRTAIGLAATGLVSLGAAAVLPSVRDVFIVLGGIGLFSGLLTWYLTPEQFVAADVSERIYGALADNGAHIVTELGLTDRRYYIPAGDEALRSRLYIPQSDIETIPPEWQPSDTFVIGDDRVPDGLALTPAGAELYREFDRTADSETSDRGVPRIRQVAEAIVELFELARGTDLGVSLGEGQATLTVIEPTIGDAGDFDTPVASFFAVGVGESLTAPVQLTDITASGETNQFTVTVRWDPDVVTIEDTDETTPSATEEA